MSCCSDTVLLFVSTQPDDDRPGHRVQFSDHDRSNTQPKKSSQIKLGEQPECAADVKRWCSKLGGANNFAVIDCLQNDNLASTIDLFGII